MKIIWKFTIVHFADTHLGRVISQSTDVYSGYIIPFIHNFNHINILKWDSNLGLSEQSYLNLDWLFSPLSHHGWIRERGEGEWEVAFINNAATLHLLFMCILKALKLEDLSILQGKSKSQSKNSEDAEV